MIIDIVKKSTNSKLLKFFFHDILKINLGKLILPRIFISYRSPESQKIKKIRAQKALKIEKPYF